MMRNACFVPDGSHPENHSTPEKDQGFRDAGLSIMVATGTTCRLRPAAELNAEEADHHPGTTMRCFNWYQARSRMIDLPHLRRMSTLAAPAAPGVRRVFPDQ